LPAGFNSIQHHSLGLAVQSALYPANSVALQATGCQLLYTMGDSVKGFAEVYVDYINSLSHIHQVGHSITRRSDWLSRTCTILCTSEN